jgi:hypothetical protein
MPFERYDQLCDGPEDRAAIGTKQGTISLCEASDRARLIVCAAGCGNHSTDRIRSLIK